MIGRRLCAPVNLGTHLGRGGFHTHSLFLGQPGARLPCGPRQHLLRGKVEEIAGLLDSILKNYALKFAYYTFEKLVFKQRLTVSCVTLRTPRGMADP
jgi:hypothetical protein